MKRIMLFFVAIILISTGFMLGRVVDDKEIPQSVMLNSGPGLLEMQSSVEEFLSAWNNGDAKGCANTYSEDALFITPESGIIKGRQAIQDRFAKEVPDNIGEMKITEEVQEVIYFEDWAATRGLGNIAVQKADSTWENAPFNWVMLCKRNAEGKWESVWDIYNEVDQ